MDLTAGNNKLSRKSSVALHFVISSPNGLAVTSPLFRPQSQQNQCWSVNSQNFNSCKFSGALAPWLQRKKQLCRIKYNWHLEKCWPVAGGKREKMFHKKHWGATWLVIQYEAPVSILNDFQFYKTAKIVSNNQCCLNKKHTALLICSLRFNVRPLLFG